MDRRAVESEQMCEREQVTTMADDVERLELTGCPQCGLPAEVTDRFAWDSTDGPVEHATVRCVARHRFVMPVATLTTSSGPSRPRVAERR